MYTANFNGQPTKDEGGSPVSTYSRGSAGLVKGFGARRPEPTGEGGTQVSFLAEANARRSLHSDVDEQAEAGTCCFVRRGTGESRADKAKLKVLNSNRTAWQSKAEGKFEAIFR